MTERLYNTKRATELGVMRRLSELTIKWMAMDKKKMESVVHKAMREPRQGSMALTNSMQALLDVRVRETVVNPVEIARLKRMLDTRDTSQLGRNANQNQIREIAAYLCNELNTQPPHSKAMATFLIQVNESNALGMSTEEWTLAQTKDVFANFSSKTPRGMNAVIFGLTAMHNKSPSLVSFVRPDNTGTAHVHNVAHQPLLEILGQLESSNKGSVVRALFQNDYESARAFVLKDRHFAYAETRIVGANLDTTDLDKAGLSM